MSAQETLLLIYAVLINCIGLLLFAFDKHQAKRGGWRIPENALLVCGALGGAFGALAGMYLFHHKTRKKRFVILMPVLAVIWLMIIGSLALKIK